ncbi:MAG: SDR family NAD(P)-dependent oxidoreductase [Acidimicrobiales bacterium]
MGDTLLEATVVPSFSRIGPAVRRRLDQWTPPPRVDGARMLVTGASSGIGRAVAVGLVERGAEVIVTSRSLDRAEQAATGIEEEAADRAVGNRTVGNRTGGSGPGRAVPAALDTADFGSVNALVERLSLEGDPLTAIVHNAGALTADFRTNDEGMELTLASHLVGPYHLTTALRHRLTTPGRVLWMSSGGMYTQGLDVDRLELHEEHYRGAVAYARAKRAQVELVELLGRRWHPEVIMHAMHPGWVATGGIDEGLPGFSTVMGPLLRSAEAGADTMIWLACGGADDAAPGSFFLDRRRRGTAYLPGTGTDDAERQRLLEWLDLVTLPARSTTAN